MGKEWIEKKLLLRDLGNFLEDHPNTVRVKRNHYFLRITFDTGITEYWCLNEEAYGQRSVNRFTPNFDHLHSDFKPTKHRQFEVNQQLYPIKYEILKNHFIVKSSDLQKMGWVDARFYIHDFAVKLVEEGWIDLKYDHRLLWEEVERIKEVPLERFQSNMIRFSPLRKGRPEGRRLILHFMPNNLEPYWNFNHIWKALNLLYKQKRDFTRENIAYAIGRGLAGLGIKGYVARHPNFYRALFKQWFNVDGKRVYDLNPDWGFTSLAVLLDGGTYLHPPMSEEYNDGMKRMAKFLEVQSDISTDDIDFLIANDITRPSTANEATEILQSIPYSEYVMITVWKDDWKESLDRFKPWRSLRIEKPISGPMKDNYILIIKNIPR